MSQEIDTKVVEMQFDNSNFEENVQTSLKTLDALKEALNFDGISKSFANLEKMVSKIDLSPISEATEEVSIKFSAFEAVALAALANITNSAMATGEKLIKSLSVDNIATGWEKFGDKTVSVGTLVAQGYGMDTVTAQLERLNWYTDETSYNFTEMVSNIAKFTATGQDLETSVTAMEGIANWAALSGQNANTASRAMYNISQAMGAGTMRLIDYRSIQNASMDTEEFRQKVLDAAVELGTLKRVANDTYQTIDGKASFTKAGFTNELAKGWFDKKVMMKVFNDYSAAVDDIYEYAVNNGITASEAIEALGGNVDEFGLKAFKAAQEARTWVDVLNSVKDAVSTGWMNTFENIFGDYEHAKQLWTDLANELYDVFAEGGNQRNDLLKEWNQLGGRTKLIETFWNAFHSLTDAINLVKDAFKTIIPDRTAVQLYNMTDALLNISRQFKMDEETAEAFSFALKTVFSILNLGIKTIAAVVQGFYPLIDAIKVLIHDFLYVTRPIGEVIQEFDKATKAMHLFDEITYQVSRTVSILAEYVKGLVAVHINDFFVGFNKDGTILSGIINMLIGHFGHLIRTILEFVSEVTGIDLSSFENDILTVFKNVSQFIENSVRSILDSIGNIKNYLNKNGIGDSLNKIAGKVKVAVTAIKNAIISFTGSLANFKIPDFRGIVQSVIQSLYSMDFSIITNLAKNVKTAVGNLIKSFNVPSLYEIIETLLKIVRSGFATLITKDIYTLLQSLQSVGSYQGILGSISRGFSDAFDAISESLMLVQSRLKADTLKSIAISIGILSASLFVLAAIPTEQMASGVTGLLTVIGALALILNSFVKVMAPVSVAKLGQLSISIMALSVAVGILAVSLKTLSTVDAMGLVKGFVTIFGLVGTISKASSTLSNSTGFIKFAGSLIVLAAALNMLIPPMVIFGNMKLESIAKGMFAMIGTMELLSLVLRDLAEGLFMFDSGTMTGVAAMVVLAAALNMLIPPMVIFGNMKLESIAKGMFAMIGTMELLSLVLQDITIKMQGMMGPMVAGAATMLLFTAAINALIPPMVIFGNMKLESIAKGMFAMIGTMELLSLVLTDMGAKMQLFPGAMAAGAASFIILAAAMNMLIPPMVIFGGMPIADIGKGIFAMVASVSLLGVALEGLMGSMLGVGVLAAAAIALNLLIPVVLTFGSLNLGQLGTMLLIFAGGLAAMVGGLLILSATAVALAPGLGVLFGVAAAFGAIAVGVAILAPALSLLATTGAVLVVSIIEGLHELAQNIEAVIDDTVTVVYAGLKGIADIVGYALVGILEGLNDILPPLLDIIIKVIAGACEVLDQSGPLLIDIIVDTILDLLDAIAARAGDIVQAIVDITIQLIDAFADALSDPENVRKLKESLRRLLVGAYDFITEFFGINSPSTKMEWVGTMIMQGLLNGLLKCADMIIDGIASIFQGIHEFIQEYLADIPKAMRDGMELIKDELSGVRDSISDGLKSFFLGTNFVAGFVDGINNAKDQAVEAVSNFGTGCIDKIKEVFQIHSPSEVLEKIGAYFGIGFDNGVDGMREKARNTVSNFGNSALSGLEGLSDGFFNSGESNALSYLSGWDSGVNEWTKKTWTLSKEQMMAGADYALQQGALARQNMVKQETESTDPTADLTENLYGEQESDLEKQLKADLEQVDILYNTGVIESEEEYHKRRLALLENYKGEWNKTTSSWLKAERDWFKKQEESSKKASKSSSNVFTEFGKTIDGVYDRAAEKYDRLLEKYKSGEITAAEYEKRYNNLLASSLFARNKLVEHADEEMQKYTEEMLQEVSDEYEDKLSDIYSKMESFSENMQGDLKDSFTFKTQSDVQTEAYNNASEDLDIQIRVLEKKRDEAAKLYGESNWYTVKLQKELDEANKKADRLSKRHQREQDNLGDEKLMALDDQIAKLEDQRDSIVKMYGENAAKARELDKQIKDLEKQEDEYMLSEEYRENRKTRAKQKEKLDSKIVGVEFTDQLKEDAENLKKYNEELKKLTKRNVSSGFYDILKGMSQEEGLAFAEYLNGLTDAELMEINNQWEAKKSASKEISETMYADEIENATVDYSSKVSDILAELPDSGYEAGQKAMRSVASGFSEEANAALESINTTMFDVIDGIFDDTAKIRIENKMRDSMLPAWKKVVKEMQLNFDEQSFNIYLHPVIDLSDSGLSTALFGAGGISGINTSELNSQAISAGFKNAKQNDISEVKESIDTQNADFNRFTTLFERRMTNLENAYKDTTIVIDANSLADGLAPPLSKRMGAMAKMQRRGV